MLFLSFSASIAIFLLHFQGYPLCFAFVSPLSIALMLQHPQEGFYDIYLNLGGECFALKLLVSNWDKSIQTVFIHCYTFIIFFVINNGFHQSHFFLALGFFFFCLVASLFLHETLVQSLKSSTLQFRDTVPSIITLTAAPDIALAYLSH